MQIARIHRYNSTVSPYVQGLVKSVYTGVMAARPFLGKPQVLTQMLILRLEGWSEYALARKYAVDKSTVENWCDKFDIVPIFGGQTSARHVTVIKVEIHNPKHKQYKYQHLFDEENEVNEGRDYSYYRVQGRKRDLIKQGTLRYEV